MALNLQPLFPGFGTPDQVLESSTWTQSCSTCRLAGPGVRVHQSAAEAEQTHSEVTVMNKMGKQ